MSMSTPRIRIRRCNNAPVVPGGDFVLYWMVAARRTRWNFALQRAAEHAAALRLPLVVLEPLRAGHRWACARFHRFVIDGMIDNRASLRGNDRVSYHPYLEPRHGAGKGLVEALAAHAAVVVTDDFPAFFLPAMLRAVAPRLSVRIEAVDSNGLLPMRAADRTFATAYQFRRFIQRNLPTHLQQAPAPDPLAPLATNAPSAAPAAHIPSAILDRWPPADLDDPPTTIATLPIDHTVAPVARRGGPVQAADRLATFVDRLLPALRDRPQPARARRNQRPLAPPPLRPHLRARGLRPGGGVRALEPRPPRRRREGQPRRVVGHERERRGLPGPTGDLA